MCVSCYFVVLRIECFELRGMGNAFFGAAFFWNEILQSCICIWSEFSCAAHVNLS